MNLESLPNMSDHPGCSESTVTIGPVVGEDDGQMVGRGRPWRQEEDGWDQGWECDWPRPDEAALGTDGLDLGQSWVTEPWFNMVQPDATRIRVGSYKLFELPAVLMADVLLWSQRSQQLRLRYCTVVASGMLCSSEDETCFNFACHGDLNKQILMIVLLVRCSTSSLTVRSPGGPQTGAF